MQRSVTDEAIERIRRMERCFDTLLDAENAAPEASLKNASFRECLQILTIYYESGQWLHDYELDEKGLLPKELKRGVLAQDAVFDFLDRIGSAD